MTQAIAALKPETKNQDIETGLADKYRQEMAVSLSQILAASYKLTIKSHLYHWNVVGPLFKPLHELTEQHYT